MSAPVSAEAALLDAGVNERNSMGFRIGMRDDGRLAWVFASWLTLACGGAASEAPAEAPAGTGPEVTKAESGGGATDATVRAANAGQCPQNPLLDDMEDGNGQSVQADARGGYWYTYADEAGTEIEPRGEFSMSEAGAGGSSHAARMRGKLGQSGVIYAGMGFTLTEPKAPYDVSCCKGLKFMGKQKGDGASAVRLKVGDAYTTPEGGVCKDCYNDFGAGLIFSNEWSEYTVSFADMKQENGWGEPRPRIDASLVYQVQWQVSTPGSEFDVRVDDVALFGCGDGG
ncbi:MAG TPA: hypothetical protein VF989_18655 [Polyangiaceae bacterium]